MTLPEENSKFDGSLSESIEQEIASLLEETKREAKKRASIVKYIQATQEAFKVGNIDALNKLIKSKSKNELFDVYPSARDTFDKLLIDVRRRSDKSFTELLDKVRNYCDSNSIPLRGNQPKLIVNNLLEMVLDEKNRTARVGTVFVRDVTWEKISLVLDRERCRIWGREFNPLAFRNKMLTAHTELIKIKPNPLGWVRLEDIYQTLKNQIQKTNPDWKKAGRLVAYYKDEFSADLSGLWEAQMSNKVDRPHLEFSGIRDPRLSYKLILPDGQATSYGHVRPAKEGE